MPLNLGPLDFYFFSTCALLGVLFNGVCRGFITCLKLVNEEQNIEQKNKRNLEEQKTTWTLRQMGLLIIEDIGILATSPSCPIHIGVISRIWFITHGKSVKKSSLKILRTSTKSSVSSSVEIFFDVKTPWDSQMDG